jgi:NTE family protein
VSEPTADRRGPVRGLVLSGCGARGAYEVGVLAYVLQELPAEAIRSERFQILCGSSVGAIHACFLAGSAHRPAYNISRLVSVWRSMRLERMLRLGVGDLARDIRRLLRRRQEPGSVTFNSDLLQDVVVREVPWRLIRHNLHGRQVEALAVTATHVTSGKTATFVDARGGGMPIWSRDPRRVAKATHIRPIHALASASLPYFFPAIANDGAYYCDGGLRQNMPLSPALRLGADRVLVIALREEEEGAQPLEPIVPPEPYPTPADMAGKLLDALMLDRLDYDLARLDAFNRIIERGEAIYGEEFIGRLNETVRGVRGVGYRKVETIVIRPSRDIGEMATAFARTARPSLGGVPGWMLSKLGGQEAIASSDLMSYLMFDGRFAEQLIQLGMADADGARARLLSFFAD